MVKNSNFQEDDMKVSPHEALKWLAEQPSGIISPEKLHLSTAIEPQEAVEADPLEKILQSPKSSDAIPKKVLDQVLQDSEAHVKGQRIKTTSYEEVKARLEQKRNTN
jgi:hypothetical protein